MEQKKYEPISNPNTITSTETSGLSISYYVWSATSIEVSVVRQRVKRDKPEK